MHQKICRYCNETKRKADIMIEVSKKDRRKYEAILKEELLTALGCTEPIAIAYAAAKAKETLGTIPDSIIVV